jgi:hypothetical protein
LYPTNVATCHGMSNLRFYPSSGAAKHHESLSLLSHVSMERIIEIYILIVLYSVIFIEKLISLNRGFFFM